MQDWRRHRSMFNTIKENFTWKVKDIHDLHPEEHLQIKDPEVSRREFRIKKSKAIMRLALVFLAMLFLVFIFVDIMNSLL